MILTLDITDSKLLKQFVVKHDYLCNKCSVLVSDVSALNKFKVASKDRALILAEMDEYEIRLRDEFESDVKASFAKSSLRRISYSLIL